MADMLKDGADWLADQEKSHASQSVTYTRRNVTPATLSATIGDTRAEHQDHQSGITIEVRHRDFLIHTADLEAAILYPPKRGDQITATVGSESQVFELLPLGSEGVFRVSDPGGKRLRIHAKQVDVA